MAEVLVATTGTSGVDVPERFDCGGVTVTGGGTGVLFVWSRPKLSDSIEMRKTTLRLFGTARGLGHCFSIFC
jgi:hypothetical protein